MFSELRRLLDRVSAKTVENFIIPLACDTDLFAEPASPIFYTNLFKLCNVSHVFVIAFIKKLFASRRLEIRTNLLLTAASFIGLLSPDVVCVTVYPEIATGLDDTSDAIYLGTLRCLSAIIPSLITMPFDLKLKPPTMMGLLDHVANHCASNFLSVSVSDRKFEYAEILRSLYESLYVSSYAKVSI